jgi:hypothetical protein
MKEDYSSLIQANKARIDGQKDNREARLIALLKKSIWLYFFLLIFEGALRKWFLPSLEGPLLIIRDPIALWLLLICWRNGLLPSTFHLVGMVIIGGISIFTAVLFGHGNLAVAIYGARILMLQFPMIFVIGRVFNESDVIKMGKALIWISIPMLVLITLQFFSPQSALVNRGVGGDTAGGGFQGANNFFRPPGTFSFTNGTHLFFGLTACFIFYFWLSSKHINKLLLTVATLCLVAAIPLSISRSLFFHVAIAFLFALICSVRKPKYRGKIMVAVIGAIISFLVLANTSFFNTASEAFFSRFSSATESEGGVKGTLGNRYIGGMLSAIETAFENPFLGQGIGLGTNVGSKLLAGERTFLVSEEEWGRLIGELGPLLGLIVIFIRIHVCIKMMKVSYRKMLKGNLLPWMLLAFGILIIPESQWAQPTYLGFSVLTGGLILASLRSLIRSKKDEAVRNHSFNKNSTVSNIVQIPTVN